MKQDPLAAQLMNYIVSGYVYFVAFTLVLFMMSSLITGVWGVITKLLAISTNASTILAAPEFKSLEFTLLHTIAFTIVLVKAYRILISYAQTRHINIKFLIEMAIIAPTIEIIFNARNYSFEVSALLATFAFANLLAYLFFYKTMKLVSTDYEQAILCEKMPKKLLKTK